MFFEGIVNRSCCQFFFKGRLIFLSLMVFNKIQSLCPCHFFTICLGTIIMDSNHCQDKTWLQTKNRLHVDLKDTEGKTAYVEYGMFAYRYHLSLGSYSGLPDKEILSFVSL